MNMYKYLLYYHEVAEITKLVKILSREDRNNYCSFLFFISVSHVDEYFIIRRKC